MITQRSELLFLYDVKNCNPNGDPMDANRPRIDDETGKCLVTDVRLKRTIRDYLFEKGFDGQEGQDIFIRDEDGKPVTGLQRSASYANKEEFINKFIDVRLFGGVSAVKKDKASKKKSKDAVAEEDETEEVLDTNKTFHLTGPVQFGMGKSLNKVKENFIKGTGAFATTEGAQQRTFREEYNISYGLIGFHGVINENAARHTRTSQSDIEELVDAMWNGTKGLLTRSKKGHMPRLLVKIDYNVKGFFIGDLIERLELVPVEGKSEESFEDVADYTVNTEQLNKILMLHADKIASIKVIQDDRIKLSGPILGK
jgi:CRISPR-associated protein Csh2